MPAFHASRYLRDRVWGKPYFFVSTAMKVAGAATSDEESESDSLEDLKDMELPTLADMDIPEPADGEEEEEEGEEDKTNTD